LFPEESSDKYEIIHTVTKYKQSSNLTSMQNTNSYCQKATDEKDGSGYWPICNFLDT
jgi:hypothetical protein